MKIQFKAHCSLKIENCLQILPVLTLTITHRKEMAQWAQTIYWENNWQGMGKFKINQRNGKESQD